MNQWKTFVIGSLTAFGLGAFIGYPIGMLSMKWTMQDAINESRSDARKCCESAYVLQKYYAGELVCKSEQAELKEVKP